MLLVASAVNKEVLSNVERCSSLCKAIRIVAWINRFICNVKLSCKAVKQSDGSVDHSCESVKQSKGSVDQSGWSVDQSGWSVD